MLKYGEVCVFEVRVVVVACVVLSGGKRDVLQEFNCFVVNWLLGMGSY
jgi:hypothetical protein